MSVNFATKYFNSIHNVLNNGQHPLVRATRNIVKDVDELGVIVLFMAIKKVSTHAATFNSVILVILAPLLSNKKVTFAQLSPLLVRLNQLQKYPGNNL